MSRKLFIDTETTGFPKLDWKNCTVEIVEIGWLLCDEAGSLLEEYSTLIKPVGKIPFYSFRVHGISTNYAKQNGKPVKQVLKQFLDVVKRADLVIGHNVSFDVRVINNVLRRNGFDDLKCETYDTIKMSGKMKLGDWYLKTFGKKLVGHRVEADVRAVYDCYFAGTRE